MYINATQTPQTTPYALQHNSYIPAILIALTIIVAVGTLIAHFTGLGLIATSACAITSGLAAFGAIIYFMHRCCANPQNSPQAHIPITASPLATDPPLSENCNYAPKDLDVFPSEIIAYTFSFLELTDIYNAMLVCKNWHTIIDNNYYVCLSPAFKKAWGTDLPSERVEALSFIDAHFGITFMKPDFIIEDFEAHIFTDHRLIDTLINSNHKSLVIYDLQTQSQHIVWEEECYNVKIAYQKEKELLITALRKKNEHSSVLLVNVIWEIKVWDIHNPQQKNCLGTFSLEDSWLESLHLEDNRIYFEMVDRKNNKQFIDVYEISDLEITHASKKTIDLIYNPQFTAQSRHNKITVRKKIIYALTNTDQKSQIQAIDTVNVSPSPMKLPFNGNLFAISNNMIILLNNNLIQIYDLETQKKIKEHKDSFSITILTIDGNMVIAGSLRSVFIWNISNDNKKIKPMLASNDWYIASLIVKGTILTITIAHALSSKRKTELWDLRKLLRNSRS